MDPLLIIILILIIFLAYLLGIITFFIYRHTFSNNKNSKDRDIDILNKNDDNDAIKRK